MNKELPPITYALIGAMCAVLLLWAYDEQYMQPYDYGFGTGFATGYKAGKDDALRPAETNHRLEEVCVSMWLSKQIRREK